MRYMMARGLPRTFACRSQVFVQVFMKNNILGIETLHLKGILNKITL